MTNYAIKILENEKSMLEKIVPDTNERELRLNEINNALKLIRSSIQVLNWE